MTSENGVKIKTRQFLLQKCFRWYIMEELMFQYWWKIINKLAVSTQFKRWLWWLDWGKNYGIFMGMSLISEFAVVLSIGVVDQKITSKVITTGLWETLTNLTTHLTRSLLIWFKLFPDDCEVKLMSCKSCTKEVERQNLNPLTTRCD